MKKFIFKKSQIELVRKNFLNEQLDNTNKLQTSTVWNLYKRGKLNADDVQNYLIQKGIQYESFGLFLKKKKYKSVDVIKFLTDIGWNEKQITKLHLPNLKMKKGGSTIGRNTLAAKSGGSLKSTGRRSTCVGPNCHMNEDKKKTKIKRYIFTETQIKNIVDSVIEESLLLTEQEEGRKHMKGVQKFLNSVYPKLQLTVDGIGGPQTTLAIKKFQISLGVYPVDGVWGPKTEEKMSEDHKKTLDTYIRESDDIFDKLVKYLTPSQ